MVDRLRSKLLVAFLFLPLALAGCADDKKGDTDGGDAATQTSTSTAPSLQAVITVTQNGTVVAAMNGTLALELGVPALFNGSLSKGLVVTYAWDFGDNSTSTDRAEEHTYAAPGLYNVTLTVSGTGNLTANTTLAVNVTGVAAGAFLGKQVFPIAGSLPLMNPNSCTNQGVDCEDFTIPLAAEFNGTPAMAKHVWVNVTGSGPFASDLQVFWRDPAGTNLAQTGASGLEHSLEYAGDMPAGDYVARIRLFIGADASYSGTVEVTYVTV